MANEKFTQLPGVVNATMADIIAAVQAGTSSQETLQQVFALYLANTILHNAGNPNGVVAGVIYQFCWDTTNSILYVCTVSGNAATAVWTASSSGIFPVTLADGGTGAALTASAGAITYSGASAMAFSAVGSAGQILQSGGAGAPTWSTPTYPSASGTSGQLLASDGTNIVYSTATFPITAGAAGSIVISNGTNNVNSTSLWPNTVGTAGQILRSNGTANAYTTSTFADTYAVSTLLYASSANVIAGLPTANSGVLITSAGGVPSISSTLPAAVQTNITALGAQSQALNMNTHLINGVVDPVSAQDAATKNYVDQTALTGLSVYAASTGTLGTVTQSGSGVGATITNGGAQIAFALDGVSIPVNSFVLIKNTSTGATAANEGIYTVTNVGSGSTNWVLTRATTYDTPAEINQTGLIIINNGSTLAGTAWYNTATIVTVDTTAFSYSQFGSSLTKKAITQITVQVITATGSSTYTPTSGMQYVTVEIVGGGGGSGGSTGAGGQAATTGGGGGGGYCRKTYTSTLIGANAAVVIGAAGAAGASGNNAGGTGGSSTFTPAGAGVILTATGGTGSAGQTSSATLNNSNGGVGGTGTNGDINISGGNGAQGLLISATAGLYSPGAGGGTPLGISTVNYSFGGGAITSNLYGSGAAGVNNATFANSAGATGAAGVCYITEYLSV